METASNNETNDVGVEKDATPTHLNISEDQLEECMSSDGKWLCPVTDCQESLSRKQTLKSHIQNRHNQRAGNPVSQYKAYEYDLSLQVPKSTFYRKRKLFTEESDQEQPGCSKQLDYGIPETENLLEIDQSLDTINDSTIEHTDSSESSDSDESQSDSENISDFDCKGQLGPPLYVIPPSETMYSSKITVEQHVLASCAFAIKYNMPTEMFQDLLSYVNLHLPQNNLCELDVSKIKQQCGFDYNLKHIHEFCSKCGALKPQTQTEEVTCQTAGCDNKFDTDSGGSYFVSVDISSQMKAVLEREENWQKIQDSHNRLRSAALTDITDGEEYIKLRQPGGFLSPPSNNVTFTFFTDGIPLFKSSKVSLWPVFLVINELPPKERYLKKNMILWGLWQGVSKPKMNTFFMKLISDLTELYTKGVTLSVNSSSVICKAMLIVLTMDLQARAYVLNMTQHNGEHGCLFCEESGEIVSKGKGRVRCYPYRENAPIKRTDESVMEAAKQAAENRTRVKGMMGRSVFMCLSYLSLVSSVVVDYMHGTLLGVTKKLLSLWFEAENQDKPFFLGKKVKLIDRYLTSIKPPYLIHRLPRKIENTYGHWKASELRSWLLFYSLPCLKGHFSNSILGHYCCLVEAVFLLLGDCITKEDVSRAQHLIEVFVKHYGAVYGKENMGQNVHNLTHMVDCVRQWGPLWTYSCFGFESFNGDILKTVHGTGNVCNQIFWSLQAQKYLENQSVKMSSGPVKNFFKSMLKGQSHKLPTCLEAYQCSVAKPMVEINLSQLQEGVRQQLVAFGTDEGSNVFKSKKLLRHEYVFYSNNCSRVRKRNSYTVKLEQKLDSDEDVVQVKYYLLNDKNRAFALCDTFQRNETYIDNRMQYLRKVTKKSENKVVPCCLFSEPMIFMDGSDGPCVINMPNRFEKD